MKIHSNRKEIKKMFEKNVMLIDTETANMVEHPLPYDVGYSIVNVENQEVLCQRSYVVAEILNPTVIR